MFNPLDGYTGREYAATILYEGDTSGCDIDAQFAAIRGLLGTLEQAESSAAEKLRQEQDKVSVLTGPVRDRADDYLVECYQNSVYDDAARSMAAVSMLAPFIEMLFTRLFGNDERQRRFRRVADAKHIRWQLKEKHQWACDRWADDEGGEKKGIAHGIPQLCEAIGMKPFLPNDLSIVLTALFIYRNNMLHNGFEWPKAKRSEFHQKMKETGCPNSWFDNATWNDEPWVCYLSRPFIDHCLDAIEQTLHGIGTYDRWVDVQK